MLIRPTSCLAQIQKDVSLQVLCVVAWLLRVLLFVLLLVVVLRVLCVFRVSCACVFGVLVPGSLAPPDSSSRVCVWLHTLRIRDTQIG